MSHVIYSYDGARDFNQSFRDMEIVDKIRKIAAQVLVLLPPRVERDCKKIQPTNQEKESQMCSPPEAEKYICTLNALNRKARVLFKSLTNIQKLNEVDKKIKKLGHIIYDYQHVDPTQIYYVLENQQDRIEKLDNKINVATDMLNKNITEEEAEMIKKRIRKKRIKRTVLSLCHNELYKNKIAEEAVKTAVFEGYNDIIKLL